MKEYIKSLNTQFEKAREHSDRGDFANFLKRIIDEDVVIINESSRIEVIAPDFVILKNNIPIFYIKAKDIIKNLDRKEFKEQFNRYIKGFDNVIFYLNFIFYSNQKEIVRISIGEIKYNQVIAFYGKFDEFKRLINFILSTHIIKSTKTLIKLFSNRALLLKEILVNSLKDEISILNVQCEAFKRSLIHYIKKEEFADIFAQTITFRMFIARYHDYILEDFIIEEARRLISYFHSFLKVLFKYISDNDEVDSRIIWIIDELVEVFLRTKLIELNKWIEAMVENIKKFVMLYSFDLVRTMFEDLIYEVKENIFTFLSNFYFKREKGILIIFVIIYLDNKFKVFE